MARPGPKRDEADGPWVGVFVLLPVVAIAAVVTLWGWRWHVTQTVEETLAANAALTPRAAPQRERRRASAPAPQATADLDAGPAALTLQSLQSMMDASALLRRNAAEAAADVARYCAEAAKAPKHLFDDPPDAGASRDAAWFLEPLVTWEGRPPTVGLLELPPPLVDRIRASGSDWTTALTVADTAGLDFDWMAQLQSYDYWSLATAGAMAEQGPTVDPFNASLPYYPLLIQWAKLRYVRALGQGDLAEAIAEVQQLAYMIHTNGLTLADASAIVIVALQSQLAIAAAQQGYPSLPPAPLDGEGSRQLRDLLIAGAAFTLPGVDESVFERAMQCVPDPCVALNEGLAQHRELDPLSERGDDDPFWSYAASHRCGDAPLLDLIKGSPSGSVGSLSGFLAGPLPLERLFGTAAAPK